MRFNIYGRMTIQITRLDNQWCAFHVSHDGKRRPVNELHIPANTPEAELITLLDDVYHEWATLKNNQITRLD